MTSNPSWIALSQALEAIALRLEAIFAHQLCKRFTAISVISESAMKLLSFSFPTLRNFAQLYDRDMLQYLQQSSSFFPSLSSPILS